MQLVDTYDNSRLQITELSMAITKRNTGVNAFSLPIGGTNLGAITKTVNN